MTVVIGELLSNIGLLEYGLPEYGLRLNSGDGVKFRKLDGELNRFRLLFLALAMLELVLQFIAGDCTFPLSMFVSRVVQVGVILCLL